MEGILMITTFLESEVESRLKKLTGYLYDRYEKKELIKKVNSSEQFFGIVQDILSCKKPHEPFPNFDSAYMYLINSIRKRGVSELDEEQYGINTDIRGRYETDNAIAPTVRIMNEQVRLDNRGNNALVLTSKRQAVKDPIVEMYWIWLMQSNDVDTLTSMGCKVWNQWKKDGEIVTDENGVNIGCGTIGTSYGYQISQKKRTIVKDEVSLAMAVNGELRDYKGTENDFADVESFQMNQLEFVIYSLRKTPLSRRIKTTLFNFEDLDGMALEPCVYETHWQVFKGELELTVNIRSNDMALGHPYNVYQYSILHKLVSLVTGIPTGDIVFNIDNVHLYERHLDEIEKQLQSDFYDLIGKSHIEIEDFGNNIYNFKPEDVKIVNYEGKSSHRYEVVV